MASFQYTPSWYSGAINTSTYSSIHYGESLGLKFIGYLNLSTKKTISVEEYDKLCSKKKREYIKKYV